MYAQKTRNFDSNNSRSGISSDDPNALEKLRAKLAEAEKDQDIMKKANAVIKNCPTEDMRIKALLPLCDNKEISARKLLEPDYAGRIGFAQYQLTNNSANIRRIRERIAELEKAETRQDKEEITDGYTYREDTEENRIMFVFDGKPDEATRALLKGRGFKWSPSRSAWIRQWTDNALYAARCVKASLAATTNPKESIVESHGNTHPPFTPPEAVNEKRIIRIIDGQYKPQFTVEDGGWIKVNGKEYQLHYIDETHFKVGPEYYHICQFGERVIDRGAIVEKLEGPEL